MFTIDGIEVRIVDVEEKYFPIFYNGKETDGLKQRVLFPCLEENRDLIARSRECIEACKNDGQEPRYCYIIRHGSRWGIGVIDYEIELTKELREDYYRAKACND